MRATCATSLQITPRWPRPCRARNSRRSCDRPAGVRPCRTAIEETSVMNVHPTNYASAVARPPHDAFVRHRGPITCVAGVPNSRLAVTSGYDGAVALFHLDTGRVELLGYHDHLVNRVTVNRSGTRAASSSSDYKVYLWNLELRTLERVLHGHSDDVEDFAYVDDLVGISVSRDQRIVMWDLTTGA